MTILKDFEKFTQTGRSFKPKISIRKRGQIGFNNGSINRFNLDEFEFVVLYLNKDKGKIAFKFTNDSDEDGAIKIVKRKNNYFVSGKAFLDYYDVNYTKSQVFECEWSPEHKVAIIDLTEGEASGDNDNADN